MVGPQSKLTPVQVVLEFLDCPVDSQGFSLYHGVVTFSRRKSTTEELLRRKVLRITVSGLQEHNTQPPVRGVRLEDESERRVDQLENRFIAEGSPQVNKGPVSLVGPLEFRSMGFRPFWRSNNGTARWLNPGMKRW